MVDHCEVAVVAGGLGQSHEAVVDDALILRVRGLPVILTRGRTDAVVDQVVRVDEADALVTRPGCLGGVDKSVLGISIIAARCQCSRQLDIYTTSLEDYLVIHTLDTMASYQILQFPENMTIGRSISQKPIRSISQI